MARKKGKIKPCSKCHTQEVLQKHHILPKRFYGDNPFYILLCDDCHKEVEKLIPETKQLTPAKYFKIIYNFINEDWKKTFETNYG